MKYDSLKELKAPLQQLFSPTVGFYAGLKIYPPAIEDKHYSHKTLLCSIANKVLDSHNESEIISIINNPSFKEAADALADDERYHVVISAMEKINSNILVFSSSLNVK
jgi:hypothetical protein